MKTVMRMEWDKIRYSKKLFVLSLCLLVLLLCTILLACLLSERTLLSNPTSVFDREGEMKLIEKRLGWAKEELHLYDSSTEEWAVTATAIKEYEYFLETNTCQFDYDEDTLSGDYAGLYLFNRIFMFGCLFVVLYGLLGAMYFVGEEYRGRFRLFVLQGVNRKELFWGKISMLYITMGVVFAVIFITGFVCALFSSSAKILISDTVNIKVYAISAFEQFFVQQISLFSLLGIATAIATFLCVWTKKSLIACLCFIFPLIIIFIILSLIKKMNDHALTFVPLYGLIPGSMMGFTPLYFIINAAHLVAIPIILTGSYYIFKRQEI